MAQSTKTEEKTVSTAVAPVALGRTKTRAEGTPLHSFGKGASQAHRAIDDSGVEIRRSGRLVVKLPSSDAIAAFVADKKLSEHDAGVLHDLLIPGNGVSLSKDKAAAHSRLQSADAEVYAWVESRRKNIDQQAHRGTERVRSSPRDESAIPEAISDKYLVVGNKFHYKTGDKRQVFVDKGDRLETKLSTKGAVEDLVKIAEARGWSEIKVSGTQEFRREAWIQATQRGLHAEGYSPTQRDKDLVQTLERQQASNGIERKRSDVFRTMPADQGARLNPELVPAYGTVAAAAVFAAQKIGDPKSQARFVDSVREDLSQRLDEGKAIPALKVREPEGRLLEHGKAKFQFNPEATDSYFVKLADSKGQERTVWGKGLETAMEASGAVIGDQLKLRVTNQEPVQVKDNQRSDTGERATEFKSAIRNEWGVSIVRSRTQELDRTR